MSAPSPRSSSRGFSLVELMVALLFTGLLMAGMSRILAASMSNFMTTNETLSATRTNRWALDLLHDDVDQACSFAASPLEYPTVSNAASSVRPFMIHPNQTLALSKAEADDPSKTDHLHLLYDAPLFEATVTSMTLNANKTYTLTVKTESESQAKQLVPGTVVALQDTQPQFTRPFLVASATTSGTSATFTTVGADQSDVSGAWQGTLDRNQAGANTRLQVYLPLQTIRYSIQGRALDPSQPGKEIPCLVREQGNYPASGAFTPTASLTQIVAENVTGFKVYLSADGGASWAGAGITATGEAGWTAIAGKLDAQLQTKGIRGGEQPGYQTIQSTAPNQAHWFRDLPFRIRIDLTTRTALKRAEYQTGAVDPNAPVAKYRTRLNTLILSPSHSGLSYY